MGFAEKRRRRAGNFGEVNDFHGRDFQINTKPSQRLIARNGNKNSGGGKQRGRPTFILDEGAGENGAEEQEGFRSFADYCASSTLKNTALESPTSVSVIGCVDVSIENPRVTNVYVRFKTPSFISHVASKEPCLCVFSGS